MGAARHYPRHESLQPRPRIGERIIAADRGTVDLGFLPCPVGEERTIEPTQIGVPSGATALDISQSAENAEPATIERVLVVGAGTMGSGIAQVIAQAGIQTTLSDADAPSLERGLAGIASRWERLAKTGRYSPQKVADFQEKLTPGTIADSTSANLVIEAIVEKPEPKS